MANPERAIENLLEDTVDFSEVARETLLDMRKKISRELEDDEGFIRREEGLKETKVKDLNGVEAAKILSELSEEF